MIYELYSIFDKSGHNERIAKYPSLPRALDGAKTFINPKVVKRFAILERARSHEPPLSIKIGSTENWKIYADRSLVIYLPNPLNDPHAGAAFWKEHWKEGETV